MESFLSSIILVLCFMQGTVLFMIPDFCGFVNPAQKTERPAAGAPRLVCHSDMQHLNDLVANPCRCFRNRDILAEGLVTRRDLDAARRQ